MVGKALSDLPNYEDYMESVTSRSTIAFASVNKTPAVVLGSATLVKFGALRGLLTCAHVVEAIAKHEVVGIVCFPPRPTQFQSRKLETKALTPVVIGGGPWNAKGPDIAFLNLPILDFANLESICSVVDLGVHFGRAATSDPESGEVFEVVAGALAEHSTETTQTARRITTHIGGLSNVGRVSNVETVDGFDLYTFDPVPAPEVQLPSSYGGTSGGGLWRFHTRADADGAREPLKHRLCGVAFWQEPKDGRLTQIICHGQKSIYIQLLRKVRERWPEECPPPPT